MSDRLTIVLGAPGEAEMPLLADLGARKDVRILGVVDPTGEAFGTSIAEIMGLTVTRDLASLPLPTEEPRPLFVLPAGPAKLVVSLGALAGACGMTTIRTDELRARLFARRAPAAPPRRIPPRPGLEEIERESSMIQDTLVGLEDALAGDTIMRRLLDLSTRAVGASGGSIMLFDEASGELYIAYASGLSEGTLHATRVKLGEGIAGRVAHTRRAELVEGVSSSVGRHRDRPDIATAVCVPLCADDRLLGVLNVSTQAGEATLDAAARDLLIGLAVRLGRILDGVQQLQRQRTSRIFDLTEQQLRRLACDHPDLPSMLAAWTGALATTAEADRVTLVVPCEDGSLLVSESAAGEDGHHWYEPLHNPAWLEVLGSGVPMVARQAEITDGDSPPVTVFYLPVGREPVRAGLSVHFSNPHAGHEFHALAGETVFLLERLLPDQVDRCRQAHRASLLADLSETVTALAAHDGTPGQLADRVCRAIARLTGAEHVAAVASIDDHTVRLAGGDVPETAPWLEDVPRLLDGAAPDGWRITTLEVGARPLSVLAATCSPEHPAPGIVLVGKNRTHELDSLVFTAQDAELALPLVGMFARFLPVEHEESDGLILDMVPLGTDLDMASRRCNEAALLTDLEREIDRCDRYHNVCGLVLLKPELPTSAALDLLAAAAKRVASGLRTSDRVYTLEDGSIAILVPEDVRHLELLQTRLRDALRDLAGDPQLTVPGARAAYPAAAGPAEAFLQHVRGRLRP